MRTLACRQTSLDRLATYADRIERDLRHNILPFWIQHVVNRPESTFHGELSNTLKLDPTVERGALLSSRILWTYSEALRTYGDDTYRDMADFAYAELTRLYSDRWHGGFFWSIHANGTPHQTRKQVYGQAFAIYALSSYHRATGNNDALATAIETFHLLETRTRDLEHRGYIEALGHNWTPIDDVRLSLIDLNAPKSQNTHLHIMEAYTALLEVWPDPALKKSLVDLMEVMLEAILDDTGCHLGLFFTKDWKPFNDTISYGHDIEAAWLLTQAAERLGDKFLLERIRQIAVKIAEATLRGAIDEDGALFYEGNPREGVINSNKEWWPQAEAIVGFLNAYQISGDERFLETAYRVWDFIETRLIDHEYGEWYRATDRTGSVIASEAKVSFWKCPYHNARAGLEATARLRAIAERTRTQNLNI